MRILIQKDKVIMELDEFDDATCYTEMQSRILDAFYNGELKIIDEGRIYKVGVLSFSSDGTVYFDKGDIVGE